MFDVVVWIGLAHEGYGLIARSEGPLARPRREYLGKRVLVGARQRSCVAAFCMTRGLRWMTAPARLASRILAGHEAGQKQESYESYQISLPLNWIWRPNTPARCATTWPKVADVTPRSGSAAGKRFIRL